MIVEGIAKLTFCEHEGDLDPLQSGGSMILKTSKPEKPKSLPQPQDGSEQEKP